jgi:hypothetical protein
MTRTRIIAGVLVVIVALIIIGALAKPPASVPAASESPAALVSPSSVAASSEPAGSSSAAASISPSPAGTQTLLDLKGSGIHRSKKFTTAGDWTIAYSYDCSKFFGGTGNFQIYVEGDTTDVAANELGKGGSGTQNEYTPGTYDLNMNSECTWHVTVKG